MTITLQCFCLRQLHWAPAPRPNPNHAESTLVSSCLPRNRSDWWEQDSSAANRSRLGMRTQAADKGKLTLFLKSGCADRTASATRPTAGSSIWAPACMPWLAPTPKTQTLWCLQLPSSSDQSCPLQCVSPKTVSYAHNKQGGPHRPLAITQFTHHGP